MGLALYSSDYTTGYGPFMEDISAFFKVRDCIANRYGYNRNQLIPITSLLIDLKIYGDDIDDICRRALR